LLRADHQAAEAQIGGARGAEYNRAKEAAMTALEKLIQELPVELQREVEDFARFLLTTKVRSNQPGRKPEKLRLGWAGALKDMREQYTSVELQHEISGWRTLRA